MKLESKVYIILCVLFSVFVVISNLIYQKFINIRFYSFVDLQLSSGAILYPLTFIITDIISENYGRKEARFCVSLGIFANLLTAFILTCFSQLEATSWSKIDNITFYNVFGQFNISFFASVLASYISQMTDIKLFLFIKKITYGKFLWFRSLVSTLCSLFLDTFIVITFLSFFQIIPLDKTIILIFDSFTFKIFLTAACTPIIYISVRVLKKSIEKKKIMDKDECISGKYLNVSE